MIVRGVSDNSSFLVAPESLPLPWGCLSIAKNVDAIRTNTTCQFYHSDTYLNHSNILHRSITAMDDFPLQPTPHGELNTQRMKHMFHKLLHAPPNTSFNILIFGGSLSTGHKLGRRLAWPAVMEGLLQKAVNKDQQKNTNTNATTTTKTTTTTTTTTTVTASPMKVNVFNRAEGGSSGHWALNRLGVLFADLSTTNDENSASATTPMSSSVSPSAHNTTITTDTTINNTTQAAAAVVSSSGVSSSSGSSSSSIGRFDGTGSADSQTPVDLVIVEYDINDCAMFGGEDKDER